MPLSQDSHPATKALHADNRLNLVTDVAPPIHLSTTFRYSNDPDQLIPSEDPIVSPPENPTTAFN
jgi:cystathionine beta-lyase/cystathionine gamma-synthase